MQKMLVSLVILASLGAGCAPLDAITSLSLDEPTPTATTTQKTPTTTLEELEKHDLGAEASAKINASVSIWDSGYSPKMITVGQGATITFKNLDKISHSVTSDIGKFDLGVMLPRGTKTFNTKNLKPGTYGFHDQLHPELKGTIKIHD
ncbi:MAG: cupredoxin domain-containing protein [Patescibacteria group bacterium]